MLNDTVMKNHKFLRGLLGHVEENIKVAGLVEKLGKRTGETERVIELFLNTEVDVTVTYGDESLHRAIKPFQAGLKVDNLRSDCVYAVRTFQQTVYDQVMECILECGPDDYTLGLLSVKLELPNKCKVHTYRFTEIGGKYLLDKGGVLLMNLPKLYIYYDLIVGGSDRNSRVERMLYMVRSLNSITEAIEKTRWLEVNSDGLEFTIDVSYQSKDRQQRRRRDGSLSSEYRTYPLMTSQPVKAACRPMLVRLVAAAFILGENSERILHKVSFTIKLKDHGVLLMKDIHRVQYLECYHAPERLDKNIQAFKAIPADVRASYAKQFDPQVIYCL